jgi:hypothetical protein
LSALKKDKSYFVFTKESLMIGSKKRRKSSKKDGVTKAVRRSHRESRKVFESLNENTLVRNLVGDYLHPNSEPGSTSSKKRRALLEEVETDSQGEVSCIFDEVHACLDKIIIHPSIRKFRNRYSNFPPNLNTVL